ncbi:mitochondrial lysine-tRNA synthetase [Ceratocystis pirilliformis]|uniref:Mitochondrial lysine-tRNA synthetase n=1 Tax=Ceratocystis pirilliformis TaxID=259994 RepID=A0ABR3ZFX9_9PEZI
MTVLQCFRLRAMSRNISGPLHPAILVTTSLPHPLLALYSHSVHRWKSSSHKPVTGSAISESLLSEEEEFSSFKRQRLERIEQTRNEDPSVPVEPYPRLQHRTPPMSVPEVRARYDDASDAINSDVDGVTVYDIVNEFRSVQVMVNWKHICEGTHLRHARFQMFTRLLEKGDHISVTGHPVRSSTGELTIKADFLPELLAPAMQPIPTEYTDADKKMSRRHIDMMITPQVSDTLRMRSDIIRFIRDFLQSRRFIEVQTPILAHNAGGAIARPFTTSSTEFPSRELALRVAPELWLKRLVVGGMQRVFEIGPAFRNEGIDHTHNPEFTMCEFYSAYTNLDDLIAQTEDLVHGLAMEAHNSIKTSLKSLPPLDLMYYQRPFQRLEFIPVLEERMQMKFPNLSTSTALPDTLTALALCGIRLPGEPPATIAKLLDRLAAQYLEPDSFNKPGFITHHPACMSPLAKSYVCPVTGQQISARAELFVQGREIANMYEEENDPEAQRRKMTEYRDAVLAARRENTHGNMLPDDAVDELDEVDMNTGEVVHHASEDSSIGYSNDSDLNSQSGPESQDYSHLGINDDKDSRISSYAINEANATIDEAPPIDNRYIEALEAGLPPTGGWGCGVERLVMMFTGAKRISDCLPFGTLKNVVSLGANVGAGGRERINRKNRKILRDERQ